MGSNPTGGTVRRTRVHPVTYDGAMPMRQVFAVLLALIGLLAAGLFVVTWSDGDDDIVTVTSSSSTTAPPSSTTAPPTTVVTSTTVPEVTCVVDSQETGADTDNAPTSTTTSAPPTTIAAENPEGSEDTPAGDSEDEPGTGGETDGPRIPALGVNDSITTVGFGEVTFGMTIAQAEAAAETNMIPCSPVEACFLVVPNAPIPGVVFTVTEGTIERVDVTSPDVTTRSGVGLGTSAERIRELFGDRIEQADPGDGTTELIFVPRDESDAKFRVIFTLRDGEVESFRSGRLEAVTSPSPCRSA